MNWERIKFIYKDKITTISNRNTDNETLIFWNGCAIMKYSTDREIKRTLLRVDRPTVLVNYAGVELGLIWPLKSKITKSHKLWHKLREL